MLNSKPALDGAPCYCGPAPAVTMAGTSAVASKDIGVHPVQDEAEQLAGLGTDCSHHVLPDVIPQIRHDVRGCSGCTHLRLGRG